MFENKKVGKKETKQKIFRVGIDARFFGLENKGLGRYTNELILGLDKIISANNKTDVRVEYYIFLPKNKFSEYIPQANNIKKVRADFKWYSWEEQIKFPSLLNQYNLDLMHFPHFNVPFFYRRKFIVTIHDLILFHYPTVKNTTLNKLTYIFKLLGYHLIIRSTIRRAKKIIAISKFTKKDLIKTLGAPESKIEVIYEGVDFNQIIGGSNIQANCDDILEKYGIIKPYLLYVGNAYPHKNLDRLVLSFKKVDREFFGKYQLVLVGKNDYFYKRLKKLIQKTGIKNIVVTDYITDNELACFYRKGRLFIFPSLYEGFGLPPLEALVNDMVVLSARESSLPEILENKVQYFQPTKIENISEAIIRALSDKNVSLTEAEKQYLQQKYNWEKMIKKINKLYLEQIK